MSPLLTAAHDRCSACGAAEVDTCLRSVGSTLHIHYLVGMGIAERERADRALYSQLLPLIVEALRAGTDPVTIARELFSDCTISDTRTDAERERLLFRWVVTTGEQVDRVRRRRALGGMALVWLGLIVSAGAAILRFGVGVGVGNGVGITEGSSMDIGVSHAIFDSAWWIAALMAGAVAVAAGVRRVARAREVALRIVAAERAGE